MYNMKRMRNVSWMIVISLVLVGPASGSETVPGSPAWWSERLADRRSVARHAARQQLLATGEAAGWILKVLAVDRDPWVRQEVALALGELPGSSVVSILVQLYFDPDPRVSHAAASSLVRDGSDAYSAIKARFAVEIDPERRQRLGWLVEQLLAGLVEWHLQQQITPAGGIGSWSDKYTALKRYRPDAVPVLLRLFGDESYRPVYRFDESRKFLIRELAGMALAEMQDRSKAVRLVLERVLRDEKLISHQQTARATLFKLGFPRLLNEQVASLQRRLSRPALDPSRRVRWLDELASCYYVQKKYSTSISCYRAILKVTPRNNNALYNAACGYALLGQVTEALDHLKRAIEAGFTDRAHVMADGDLKNLRKDPRFEKQILGHPKLKLVGPR